MEDIWAFAGIENWCTGTAKCQEFALAGAREAFLLSARESEREIRDGRETRDNGIEQEREGRGDREGES